MRGKIYIASGLTNVPEKEIQIHLSFIYDLSVFISSNGYHVESMITARNEYKEHAIKTPQDCYSGYKEIIEKSNLIISEATYPSTGMGIELQIASDKNIPIIVMSKKIDIERKPVTFSLHEQTIEFLLANDGISAMLKGLPNVLSVVSYVNKQDAYKKIKPLIMSFLPNRSQVDLNSDIGAQKNINPI